MEVVSEEDAVNLANSLAVKCRLPQRVGNMLECSSDFLILLYYAVMGELPVGILTEASSVKGHVHNVACVIDTLAEEYLHVELSHISPAAFVKRDPTTVFNLLEILDGLLEFMLDKLSSQSDSGDEGDIDSDRLSGNNGGEWSSIDKAGSDRLSNLDTSSDTVKDSLENLKISPRDAIKPARQQLLAPSSGGEKPEKLPCSKPDNFSQHSISTSAEFHTIDRHPTFESSYGFQQLQPHQDSTNGFRNMIPHRDSTDGLQSAPTFESLHPQLSEYAIDTACSGHANAELSEYTIKSTNQNAELSEYSIKSGRENAELSEYSIKSGRENGELSEHTIMRPHQDSRLPPHQDRTDSNEFQSAPSFQSLRPFWSIDSANSGHRSREFSEHTIKYTDQNAELSEHTIKSYRKNSELSEHTIKSADQNTELSEHTIMRPHQDSRLPPHQDRTDSNGFQSAPSFQFLRPFRSIDSANSGHRSREFSEHTMKSADQNVELSEHTIKSYCKNSELSEHTIKSADQNAELSEHTIMRPHQDSGLPPHQDRTDSNGFQSAPSFQFLRPFRSIDSANAGHRSREFSENTIKSADQNAELSEHTIIQPHQDSGFPSHLDATNSNWFQRMISQHETNRFQSAPTFESLRADLFIDSANTSYKNVELSEHTIKSTDQNAELSEHTIKSYRDTELSEYTIKSGEQNAELSEYTIKSDCENSDLSAYTIKSTDQHAEIGGEHVGLSKYSLESPGHNLREMPISAFDEQGHLTEYGIPVSEMSEFRTSEKANGFIRLDDESNLRPARYNNVLDHGLEPSIDETSLKSTYRVTRSSHVTHPSDMPRPSHVTHASDVSHHSNDEKYGHRPVVYTWAGVKHGASVLSDEEKSSSHYSTSTGGLDVVDGPPQLAATTLPKLVANSSNATTSEDALPEEDQAPEERLDLETTYPAIKRDRLPREDYIPPHPYEEHVAPPRDAPKKDWEALLSNLHKTVEESKRIREKYYATPTKSLPGHSSKSDFTDDTDSSFQPPAAKPTARLCKTTSEMQEGDPPSLPSGHVKAQNRPIMAELTLLSPTTGLRTMTSNSTEQAATGDRPHVRFVDSVMTSPNDVAVTSQGAENRAKFKRVLRREKQLQDLKNQVLATSYEDQLDEVTEAEHAKLRPLADRVATTQLHLRDAIARQQNKPPPRTTADAVKRNLAAAAKWKSWQTPVVHHTPRRRTNPIIRRKIVDELRIGEHDLLPTLLEHFPGLELSKTTLNDAWKKQFRQIERLTSQQSAHGASKKNSDKQLHEAHERHQLLTDIMRREHEHTTRVRDTLQRSQSKRDATVRMRERRQQSARIRRYYRDYQLQMRAKMLRRRTKEEQLFKNLFEEGLEIQRARLRELRKYARDKRHEQQQVQLNEIASLENYYRDQFAILQETLQSEKNDLAVRDKAQIKLLRQMRSGLRGKMEREITRLQEEIARDDHDCYLRELEADRIRRQLQLATYHHTFKPDQ